MPKKPTDITIARAILAAADSDGLATWPAIMQAISALYTPKNWLIEVRGVLQYLINQGFVVRQDTGRDEAYRVLRATI